MANIKSAEKRARQAVVVILDKAAIVRKGTFVRHLGFQSAAESNPCDGRGAAGPVTVVLTVIPRKELPGVVAIIKGFDPCCFYSVDDVQSAEAGVFPQPRGGRLLAVLPSPFRPLLDAPRVEQARVPVLVQKGD